MNAVAFYIDADVLETAEHPWAIIAASVLRYGNGHTHGALTAQTAVPATITTGHLTPDGWVKETLTLPTSPGEPERIVRILFEMH